jgi:Ca2+-binding EF-hand superfamily protein
MTFDEYAKVASETDYENKEPLDSIHFMSIVLGVVGEAGEIAEKFKKIYRDKDGVISNEKRI